MTVAVDFLLKEPSDKHPGKFKYTRLLPHVYEHDGSWRTSVGTPAVGDLVWVHDDEHGQGPYRVIDREWSQPAYGSQVWPLTDPQPRYIALRCVVERAEGLIQDEAPYEEDEEP